jgi:hypothetical protein
MLFGAITCRIASLVLLLTKQRSRRDTERITEIFLHSGLSSQDYPHSHMSRIPLRQHTIVQVAQRYEAHLFDLLKEYRYTASYDLAPVSAQFAGISSSASSPWSHYNNVSKKNEFFQM